MNCCIKQDQPEDLTQLHHGHQYISFQLRSQFSPKNNQADISPNTSLQDWASPIEETTLSILDLCDTVHDFAAAGSAAPTIRVQADNSRICLKGAMIDTIISIGELLGGDVPSPNLTASPSHIITLPIFVLFVIQNMIFARELGTYPTGEECEEVFLRTLIRGPPQKRTTSETQPLRDGLYAMIPYAKTLNDSKMGGDIEGPERREHKKHEEQIPYLGRQAGDRAYGRSFCKTSGGYLGLVPRTAKEGDRVAVVHGAPVPFVLHKEEGQWGSTEAVYSLVGDAYFHGLMHG